MSHVFSIYVILKASIGVRKAGPDWRKYFASVMCGIGQFDVEIPLYHCWEMFLKIILDISLTRASPIDYMIGFVVVTQSQALPR